MFVFAAKQKTYFNLEDAYKTMNFDNILNAHLVADREGKGYSITNFSVVCLMVLLFREDCIELICCFGEISCGKNTKNVVRNLSHLFSFLQSYTQ